MKLTDLKFAPTLLAELEARGFRTVEEMADLSNAFILRIPGMGGAAYRRLAGAMGRDAYAKSCRPAGRPKKNRHVILARPAAKPNCMEPANVPAVRGARRARHNSNRSQNDACRSSTRNRPSCRVLRSRCAGDHVEANDLRIGRQRRNIVPPAPAGKVFPVRSIGAAGLAELAASM
jgi:hypothetical protein